MWSLSRGRWYDEDGIDVDPCARLCRGMGVDSLGGIRMSASASQKKMLELLLETREFDDEVIEAVEMIMEDEALSSGQVLELLNILMKADEDEESSVHVGGIIRR